MLNKFSTKYFIVKKLKKTIAAFAILAFGFGLMFNSQTSVAEELVLGTYVCYQSSTGPGCTTIDGLYFPTDVQKFAPSCSNPNDD
jgi:hypothetical protein